MANIVLVFPPYLSSYKSPPLGVAYLAAVAERAGHQATLIDMNGLGTCFSELSQRLTEIEPDIVGVSFMTNQFGNAIKAAQTARSALPQASIVLGGNHASALPEESLGYDAVDYVILREGEVTFLELIEALEGQKIAPQDIKGLAFRHEGQVVRTPPRELIEDLDSLPFPKWDDFPVEAYSDRLVGVGDTHPVFSVLTSRGCPNKCAFCSSHTVFTRKYRKRSAKNIFAELEYLEERFGAQHFHFVDDTLTIDKDRVRELCSLVRDNGKNYRWIANARVNTVSKELLREMYLAGCRNLGYGVESGDPAVRKAIAKGISSEQIRNAHTWAREAGLITSSYFMVGNMGETWESIDKTIALAKELNSDNPNCAIATPFPDTTMMAEAEKHGWLRTKDWDQYITTPHIVPDYLPVSSNGILTVEEMLRAYYKVSASFAEAKLITRYGKRYWLNPRLYAREIVNRSRRQGVVSTTRLGLKLLRGKVLGR
ncbi:MAG: radical SAM protein [Proteobacteria bacterium]|jgi:anaerobic magnesium-protoporphyrin IX monomethyl ester cyclase|nr:radical SAM protein [Pseudomonadota bacterium]